jgi:hypothetical protein
MAERVSGTPAEGEAMMREARKGKSNRQARLERRRLMADSGAMPGSLAGKFTLGQDATSAIPRKNTKRSTKELVEAGLDDEAMRNPDAIEAAFKELNAADEEAARRDLCG